MKSQGFSDPVPLSGTVLDRENAVPSYRIEGQGPLLIYVAGLDGTGELFFKQAPALASSYRVASFRLRDGRHFTYDELAEDVAAIIKAAGETRATIVGESFGGTIAIAFALRHREMVDRLVIVNSFSRFRARTRIRLAALIASALPFRLTCLARKMATYLGLIADQVPADDRRRFFEIISSVTKDSYVRRLELISQVDFEERLHEITAPVLFVAGQNDLLIPSVREAQSMAAQIPDSTVRVIDGAGHACLLGNRVNLARLMAAWTEDDSTQQLVGSPTVIARDSPP